ncbi:MAG: hypothetical protein IT368_01020 [Candidatus Hydrogenedentes bacterium]|nr:hypothetical protein [Candidatus Hydrogenedentota bacterium]
MAVRIAAASLALIAAWSAVAQPGDFADCESFKNTFQQQLAAYYETRPAEAVPYSFRHWMGMLMADILCDAEAPYHDELRAAYEERLEDFRGDYRFETYFAPYEYALPAIQFMSDSERSIGLPFQLYQPHEYEPIYLNRPFSPHGDFDFDGSTNIREWAEVLQQRGTYPDFADKVTTPSEIWRYTSADFAKLDAQGATLASYLQVRFVSHEWQVDYIGDLIPSDRGNNPQEPYTVLDNAMGGLVVAVLWDTNHPLHDALTAAYGSRIEALRAEPNYPKISGLEHLFAIMTLQSATASSAYAGYLDCDWVRSCEDGDSYWSDCRYDLDCWGDRDRFPPFTILENGQPVEPFSVSYDLDGDGVPNGEILQQVPYIPPYGPAPFELSRQLALRATLDPDISDMVSPQALRYVETPPASCINNVLQNGSFTEPSCWTAQADPDRAVIEDGRVHLGPGTSRISQAFSIPAGAQALLSYKVQTEPSFPERYTQSYSEIPASEYNGGQFIAIDDRILAYVDESFTEFWPAMNTVTVEVSDFADGARHTLVIGSVSKQSQWLIDDICIDVTGVTLPYPKPCGTEKIHTADQDASMSITLAELLRVIQFFNSGGYHCAEETATEDGYAPGTGSALGCPFHDSDYEDTPDWQINLSELLRLVQFYNLGAYHWCGDSPVGSEDDFCPGWQ